MRKGTEKWIITSHEVDLFVLGWLRELIYRCSNPLVKRDVYYWPPSDYRRERIRSGVRLKTYRIGQNRYFLLSPGILLLLV